MDTELQGLHVRVGLNLLSEVASVSRQLQRTGESVAKFSANLESSRPAPQNAAAESPASGAAGRLGFWDEARFKYHCRCSLGLSSFSIHVLTGTSPYQTDSLALSVRSFQLAYVDDLVRGVVECFEIARCLSLRKSFGAGPAAGPSSSLLLRVPVVEYRVVADWANEADYSRLLAEPTLATLDRFTAKDLLIDVQIHVPSAKMKQEQAASDKQPRPSADSLERLMERSEVPILHYEANLVNELINLPQMRHEYLLLHGIRPAAFSENELTKEQASSKQQIAVYSNYLELVAYTLNEQINRKNQSIIKFLSKVRLALHTSSMRVLASNRDCPTQIVKRLGEEAELQAADRLDEAVGVQMLVESISYSTTFFKKSLKIRGASPEDHRLVVEKDSGIQVWDFRDGLGKVRCIVSGYLYRSLKLLAFDRAALLKHKQAHRSDCMEDFGCFREFFRLRPPVCREVEVCEGASQHSLFDHQLLARRAGLEEAAHLPEDLLSPETLRAVSKGILQFVFTLEHRQALGWEFEDILDEPKLFEFDQFEVFFSTELILYEQAKTAQFSVVEGEHSLKVVRSATFDSFVTLIGSRICLTYSTMKVINNMLQVKNDRDINKKKLRDKKKKQEAAGKAPADLPQAPEAAAPAPQEPPVPPADGRQEEAGGVPGVEETASASPGDVTVRHVFGVSIEKPQINFNNYLNFNQTIFTSKEACFVYLDATFLRYDFFSIDAKYALKVIFKELELFNSTLSLPQSTRPTSPRRTTSSGSKTSTRSTAKSSSGCSTPTRPSSRRPTTPSKSPSSTFRSRSTSGTSQTSTSGSPGRRASHSGTASPEIRSSR